MRRIPITTTCQLLLLLLLSACAAPGPVSTGVPTVPGVPVESMAQPWAAAPELFGAEWVLVELNGAAPLAGSQITLAFGEMGISGYAGCNWYNAGYLETGVEGAPAGIAFSLTKRACQEAGRMEQEQVLMTALQSAVGRRRAGERLEFHAAAGDIVAAFTALPQLDMNPADLVGTRWQLVRLAGAAPLAAPRPTLVFDSDTAFSGHSGCRDFQGAYQAKDDDLFVGSLEILTTDCADPARLQQEGEYTTLLSETTHYRLAEGELELMTLNGKNLLFAVGP